MQPNRRKFLIQTGAATLGVFLVPYAPVDAEELETKNELPEANVNREPKVRRVISTPVWKPHVMVWLEDHDGEATAMMWTYMTVAEREEAQRFYDACQYRDWNTLDELRARPREPGNWVVRYRLVNDTFGYLVNFDLDEVNLREEEDVLFDYDFSRAAVTDHNTALNTIILMTTEFDLEGNDLHYDAARLEDESRLLTNPQSMLEG